MNTTKFILFAVSTLVATSAFAGGGSSIGPGAPRYEYICRDKGENVEALIMAVWPKYQREIVVNTLVPFTQTLDKPVARRPSGNIGGDLVYVGKRFRIGLKTTTAPVEKDGHIYVRAELRDLARENAGMAYRALPLLCEFAGSNMPNSNTPDHN